MDIRRNRIVTHSLSTVKVTSIVLMLYNSEKPTGAMGGL